MKKNKLFSLLVLIISSIDYKTFILLIIHILSSLIPAIQIYYFAQLINHIINDISSNMMMSQAVFILFPDLLIISAVLFVKKINQMFRDPLNTLISKQINISLNQKILNKVIDTPLLLREKTDFQNKLSVAHLFVQNFVNINVELINGIKSFLTMISILFVVINYSFILGVVLAIASIPIGVIGVLESKTSHALKRNIISIERIETYYDQLLTSIEQVKENIVFHLYPYFQKKWENQFDLKNEKIWKVTKKNAVSNMVGISFSLFGYIVCVSYMLFQIDIYIPVVDSMTDMRNAISSFLSSMTKVYDIYHYYDGYYIFMNDNIIIDNGKVEYSFEKEIVFNDVSFCHTPGCYSLQNVSFKINKGETIGILGENGAGKTTITRLLMGLYQPTCGNIKFDNIPLTEINKEELLSNIAYLSQYSARIYLTIRENFKLVDPKIEDEKIWESLKLVGLADIVANYPKKLDTKLGKNLNDGIELSGGEWQRLAIARVLSTSKEIFIFDEPTSAMDPISETEMFQLLFTLCSKKTLILISHRIGIAKYCDRLFIVDNHRIVEEGTITELEEKKGKYTELLESQRKLYEG